MRFSRNTCIQESYQQDIRTNALIIEKWSSPLKIPVDIMVMIRLYWHDLLTIAMNQDKLTINFHSEDTYLLFRILMQKAQLEIITHKINCLTNEENKTQTYTMPRPLRNRFIGYHEFPENNTIINNEVYVTEKQNIPGVLFVLYKNKLISKTAFMRAAKKIMLSHNKYAFHHYRVAIKDTSPHKDETKHEKSLCSNKLSSILSR